MGDRLQVQIKETFGNGTEQDVYLYTHWGGTRVRENIKKYLKRAHEEGRLFDGAYLARMIFCDMLNEDTEGSTGYGIMSYRQGDADLIVIDLDEKTLDDTPLKEFLPL